MDHSFLATRRQLPYGARSGLPEVPYTSQKQAPVQHHFSPYADNGGTILGIAGDDFAVIAGDTRLSEGYSIHSREESKLFRMNNTTVLASAGFQGDCLTLHKNLQWKLTTYKHNHDKDMSTTAVGQMLSTMLYYKRFFPYYTYNILAGLDEEGKGAVFSYDPVGSYERETYRAGGSGAQLLQPLLDSELGQKNKLNAEKLKLTKEDVVNVVKDAFAGVAERDIYTGDAVEIVVITKDGITTEMFPLRRD
eukprot:comp21352_c0_seq1/m.29296 comp21352_c0_seq1/g.29296  ORF comp21352_c0_seq1/g.29296 comp21352_c0_seq1/m.29296 type:complete len:249 (-) comp21352_c0_seq1:70-816(-)